VPTIEDLAAGAATLSELGALVGQSDHGATKSLYARDPDGNEFEVMWMLPKDQWGDYDRSAPIRPLDLAREVAEHGGR
jgi:catechol-2,3-dioxygenase